MNNNTFEWSNLLKDKRSKKVIFLAHCLLNENTRYLGGACYQGPIPEIVKTCIEHGIGIVQLPCPEQHAWGGVLKKRLLFFYGSKGIIWCWLRKLLLPIALLYTKHVYRKLANQAVYLIEDYKNSDIKILGLVGVDASPSCGVCTTINIPKAVMSLGRITKDLTSSDDINQIVMKNVEAGQGFYIERIKRELNKRGINIPFIAHDIINELKGNPSTADIQSLIN